MDRPDLLLHKRHDGGTAGTAAVIFEHPTSIESSPCRLTDSSPLQLPDPGLSLQLAPRHGVSTFSAQKLQGDNHESGAVDAHLDAAAIASSNGFGWGSPGK